ncbi:MAG: hypothetical protein U0165_15150 [Polyangiaceae bacterium]
MSSPFRDPTIVSPTIAPLLESMLASPRPAYAHAARFAREEIEARSLIGIQTSTEAFWIRSRARGAPVLTAAAGAHVQTHNLRSSPRSARDILCWVVVQDGFTGGAMVMAHELCHMKNRFAVWQLAQQPPDLVDLALGDGFSREQLGWVRATFVNEVAARHVAYLGEANVRPGETPMPEKGSLVGCATTIARYPAIYNDCGVMQRLLNLRDENLLRDQVGRWFAGLRGFTFFAPDSPFHEAHVAFLEAEIEHASMGHRVPWVVGDGTL